MSVAANKRSVKSKPLVWRPRPAEEIERAVRHVARHPKSVQTLVRWGLENPGPRTTDEAIKGLRLSRRTIKSAQSVLLAERMAERLDTWTRSGRSTVWVYHGVPSMDLTDDLGIVQTPSSEGSWHRASPAVEIARCQDQQIMPVSCENGEKLGQRGGRALTEESVSSCPEKKKRRSHSSVELEPTYARTPAREAEPPNSLAPTPLVDAYWQHYEKLLAEKGRYAPYGAHETQIRQTLAEHLSRYSLDDVRDALGYLFERSYAPHRPHVVEQFMAGHLAGRPTVDALEGKDLLRDELHRELALVPDRSEPEPNPESVVEAPAPIRRGPRIERRRDGSVVVHRGPAPRTAVSPLRRAAEAKLAALRERSQAMVEEAVQRAAQAQERAV